MVVAPSSASAWLCEVPVLGVLAHIHPHSATAHTQDYLDKSVKLKRMARCQPFLSYYNFFPSLSIILSREVSLFFL